jgi:hypothetical protein
MTPNPEFMAVMGANFPADARLLIGWGDGWRSAGFTVESELPPGRSYSELRARAVGESR